MRILLIAGMMFGCCQMGLGEIHTEAISHEHDGLVLEGWLAYDSTITGPRPGVLIVHQWMGLGDYEKGRAAMLAKLGYTAFAVDIYGKGLRPKNTGEAGALAGKFKGDRRLLRSRVNAGLAVLKNHPLTDPKRIAAIGYCFGGTAVLELARSGAEIGGVVTFHGGLDSPDPGAGSAIHAKVLALHGADDPFVPPKDVAAFQEEMRRGRVDWQMVSYGGAVHSFTERAAGTDNSKGAAYNEAADIRSWAAMRAFLDELFKD